MGIKRKENPDRVQRGLNHALQRLFEKNGIRIM